MDGGMIELQLWIVIALMVVGIFSLWMLRR